MKPALPTLASCAYLTAAVMLAAMQHQTGRIATSIRPLCALSLLLVCCGDDGGTSTGMDASVPSTVFEHLVDVGDWMLDTRIRSSDCEECRYVAQYEFAPDGTEMAIVRYADVAEAGQTDGEEFCRNVYSIEEVPSGEVDSAIRSGVSITLDSNTCGNPNGGSGRLIFDAAMPVNQGPIAFTTVYGSVSQSLYDAWPGFRESPDDTRFASVYRPCPASERAPDRPYCQPSCDTPATEAGEVECTYPSFTPPFPACNAVTNGGAPVEQTQIAAELPAAIGGTPTDGTYHLTSWNIYTGIGGTAGGTGTMRAMTGAVSGDSVSMVSELGPGAREHANYTLLHSGPSIIVSETCPNADGVAFDTFSVSGEMLIIFDTIGGASLEFTRVP